jgi:ATP-dependent Clp protease protease subunit
MGGIDLNELVAKLKETADPILFEYFKGLNERILIINDEISIQIVEMGILPLLRWQQEDVGKPVEERKPITIFLNTPGGDVYNGLVLCDIIEQTETPINIIVLAYAYSMGSLVLISGSGNPLVKRYAYPFSSALIHAGNVQAGGDQNAVRDYFEFNDRFEKRIKNFFLKKTKITEPEYDKMYRKQWYFDSTMMLEKGMIDGIITSSCDLSKCITTVEKPVVETKAKKKRSGTA